MFPRLFTIPAFDALGRSVGPFTLHSYGALLAIAFVAGLWVASRQAKKEGLDSDRISDLAIYVLLSGLLGAKLMLVLVEWKHLSLRPVDFFTLLQSGGVFYGGLLVALPVAFLYARRHGLDGWKTADALAPGVILGQAIGRLGCFSAGCCHGSPTAVAWAVTYSDEYAAKAVGVPLGIPVHPVQLYESVIAFGLFFLLLRIARTKKYDGQVVLSYLLFYAIARFGLELFRGDVVRGFVLGGLFSTSQAVALVLAAGALAVMPQLARTHRVAARAAEGA